MQGLIGGKNYLLMNKCLAIMCYSILMFQWQRGLCIAALQPWDHSPAGISR